ncbi:MAG TPA: hypothetical protein VMT81_03505 [Candidatus Paceibacterota bacterium]|nr:hypothetical protein [Candidatus Paceibacterota bacterium]
MASDFRRRLIVGLSVIFGSIALAAVALYILSNTIDAAVKKIGTDRALIAQEGGLLGVLASLKQQEPQAEVYQGAITQLLPTQDGLIGFGPWLDAIAANHQVSASASFGSNIVPPSSGQLGAAPVSISATGNADDLAAFLADAESGTPGFLLDIISFDLTGNGDSYRLTASGIVSFRP